MKVVIAPNAFKGSLTASQAAAAMATGVVRVAPRAEVVQVPVADGGDGLVDVVLHALNGELRNMMASGPRGDPVHAAYCFVPGTGLAAIEMALASGLVLLPRDQHDPTLTTTLGTGEIISAVLQLGASRIVVGIGGSATNDGGVGMATALGVRFLDEANNPVKPLGGELGRIRHIDMNCLDPRINHVRVEAVCDVDNPLTGPNGAARVYGPQKGATPEQVEQLSHGLANLAKVIRADLGLDVEGLPGAGAAGGLGAGMHAFLGAELRRGVDLVLELVGLDATLEGADLVLTGEGQIDPQTARGKAPAGVGAAAKARGVHCLAVGGSVEPGLNVLHDCGIDAIFSLCPGPIARERAIRDGARLIADATEQAVRCYLAGQSTRYSWRR